MKFLLAILILGAAAVGYLKYNPTWWPQHQDQILDLVKKIPGAEKLLAKSKDAVVLPALPDLDDGDPKDTSKLQDDPAQGPIAERKEWTDTERDYQYYFLREIFPQLRQQELEVEDAQKWMNVLEQGGSRQGIIRALILDDYYYKLQMQQVPNSAATIKFAQDYAEKFLGVSYSAEDLGQVDFFTLKKELIEKTLRLLDLLLAEGTPTAKNNFANWYGVFSAQVAKDYPELFTDPVRGKKGQSIHRQWALDNEASYVYSEVIIKLCKILNQLNAGQEPAKKAMGAVP